MTNVVMVFVSSILTLQLKYKIMNDITGIVVKNLLQEKLKKYKVYYNSSYQYKDYDMSDYYELKIKELELKINKII